MKVKVLVAQSCLTPFDPMDCVAWQAPLSMEFCRQEYWSGLPFSSPRDFPNTGIKLRFPAFQADLLPFVPPGKSYMLHSISYYSAFACQGSQSP